MVAGGSKGIGFGLAEALARRKYNLILVDKCEESLQTAKAQLESVYGVQVEPLHYDLSREDSAQEITAWCAERDIHLKALCNVAGLGGVGDYLTLPLESLRYMIRINVESGMALAYSLLPLLEKNAPAHILNVSSLAAFAPIPKKNMYAATKSAVLYFSYALRYQLRKRNISVSCLVPGPVSSKPEICESTRRELGWLGMRMEMTPQQVGEIGVRKMLKGNMLIVPGKLAHMVSVILRMVPKRWSASFLYRAGGE